MFGGFEDKVKAKEANDKLIDEFRKKHEKTQPTIEDIKDLYNQLNYKIKY